MCKMAHTQFQELVLMCSSTMDGETEAETLSKQRQARMQVSGIYEDTACDVASVHEAANTIHPLPPGKEAQLVATLVQHPESKGPLCSVSHRNSH